MGIAILYQFFHHPTHTPLHHSDDRHYTMRCGWLEGVLSLDGTLSKKEHHKRKLFFAVNAAAMLMQLFIVFFYAMHNTTAMLVATLIGTLTGFVSVLLVLCRCKVTENVVLCVAYSYLSTVLVADCSSQSRGESNWGTLVLIVDFLLVMEADARYSLAAAVISCGWICLTGAEMYFRFGLFDLPGMAPQHGEGSRWEKYRERGECTELPCPKIPFGSMLYALEVFVVDFVATRGFAREVRKEQATMERTINTVQEIASLLAGYDVERVAELLAEHEGQLPEEMTSALRSLEENLRAYKAYLPKTCLPLDGGNVPVEKGVLLRDQDDLQPSGSETSFTGSSGVKVTALPMQVQSLTLMPTNATLLTLNIKDTLSLLEKDVISFSQLFTSVLMKTLQASDLRRGMVDVFVGDRIHCSFNTSRQCATHATSALHTATMLMQGNDEVRTHVNMGLATGSVLRGDMGCHVMRRFSMVGALVRDVLAIERAGRELGCDVLCNRLCFSDAECEHNLRLIPCKVELAADCEAEVLGELVVATEVGASEADEWMYQIGEKKDWDDYNQAVRRFLKGETSAAAVAAEALHGNCAKYPVHVTASLDCLRLPSYANKVESVCLPI